MHPFDVLQAVIAAALQSHMNSGSMPNQTGAPPRSTAVPQNPVKMQNWPPSGSFQGATNMAGDERPDPANQGSLNKVERGRDSNVNSFIKQHVFQV